MIREFLTFTFRGAPARLAPVVIEEALPVTASTPSAPPTLLLYRYRIVIYMNIVVSAILILSFVAIAWLLIVREGVEVPSFLQNSFSLSFGFFINAVATFLGTDEARLSRGSH